MKKHLYLHIKSTSLAHYFVSGAITPTKYIKSKIIDVQDTFPLNILLSNKKFNENCDCSLKIILSVEEYDKLTKVNDNYFLFNNWLPISRIEQITFNNKEQSETTIWNIEQGAAFVPQELITIEKKTENEIAKNPKSLNNESLNDNHKSKLESEINLYDRVLGAITFLQVLNGLKDDQINSSIPYLSLLSFFDQDLKNQYLNQNGTINKKYNILVDPTIKDNTYKNYLNSSLNEQEIQNASKFYNVKLTKKFGAINIEEIKDQNYFYILAIVSDYGQSGSKNELDLIEDIYNNKFNNKRLEGLCLAYGLHRGYKSLRNSYAVMTNNLIVKFKMDSNFDKNCLESIYAHVKQRPKNKLFASLDTGSNKIEISPKFISYHLYDKLNIIGKHDFRSHIDILTSKIFESFSKIFNPKFVSINEQELLKIIRTDVEDTIKLIDLTHNKLIDNIQDYYKKHDSQEKNDKNEVDLSTSNPPEVKSPNEVIFQITNKEESNAISRTQKNLFDTKSTSELSKFRNQSDFIKHIKTLKKKELSEFCKLEYISTNSKMKKDDLIKALIEKYKNAT